VELEPRGAVGSVEDQRVTIIAAVGFPLLGNLLSPTQPAERPGRAGDGRCRDQQVEVVHEAPGAVGKEVVEEAQGALEKDRLDASLVKDRQYSQEICTQATVAFLAGRAHRGE
jgi:hypothetical protein